MPIAYMLFPLLYALLSGPLFSSGSRLVGAFSPKFFTSEWHKELDNGNNQMPRNHIHCIPGAN